MKTEKEKDIMANVKWSVIDSAINLDDVPMSFSRNSIKIFVRQEIDNYLREIGCTLVEKNESESEE